jgi:hypothetical protein
MANYFQTDDRDDYFESLGKKGDCKHTHYKIVVDGKVIKKGRFAIKQTRKIENRVIYKRRWNVSRKIYENDWTLI